MSAIDDLNELIRRFPPWPQEPEQMTVISCVEHGGDVGPGQQANVVALVRDIYSHPDLIVMTPPCGCVVFWGPKVATRIYAEADARWERSMRERLVLG